MYATVMCGKPFSRLVAMGMLMSSTMWFAPMTFANDANAGPGRVPAVDDAAPARDGEVAIREEFDLAVKRGTREALELFIRRHPEHALAKEAGKLIEKMEKPAGPEKEGR